jgi:hypothetical protein
MVVVFLFADLSFLSAQEALCTWMDMRKLCEKYALMEGVDCYKFLL